MATLPCFGAVEVSLVSRPDVDFDLKVLGGDLLSIPGLGGWIHSFIEEVMADMIVHPKRLVVPMVDSLEGMKPQGLWIVKVVEARNLPRADFFGAGADPYVTLTISSPPMIVGGDETEFPNHARTKTVSHTKNPKWEDQVFSFVVHDPDAQYVDIHVFDADSYGGDDLLGSCRVDLKKLIPGEVNDDWLTLSLPDQFKHKIESRFRARKRAGLTTRKRPKEVQLRIKHIFNFFIKTNRSVGEDGGGGEDDLDDAIDSTVRSSSHGEFATMKHGLLSLTIVKAKLANAHVYGHAYAKIRLIQVDRYRDSESNREKLRAAQSLFVGEDDDRGPDFSDDGGDAVASDDDESHIETGNLSDGSYSLGTMHLRPSSPLRKQSFNIGVQETRQVPKADILFVSKTTTKVSDVDLRWDERFEYVLSEAEYDENKQMERNLAPKAIVIQVILVRPD